MFLTIRLTLPAVIVAADRFDFGWSLQKACQVTHSVDIKK
jgi:hypothetical protein